MESTLNIKFNRLVLAMAVTFLLADIYPHPNLSPGLVEGLSNRVHTALTQLFKN